MCRNKEELANIVIGEAVLSLADDYLDISAVTIAEKLREMLKAETDETRRKILIDAIQQTCLSPAWVPDGTVLPPDSEPFTVRFFHSRN